MTARTTKIVHRSIKGVAGERRVPITVISTNGTVECLVPHDWFPCNRAGLSKWTLVRTFNDQSTAWQAR